jgi:hypothetical protein
VAGRGLLDLRLDAFLLPAYYQQTWVDWGEAFANWEHTHGKKAGNAIVTLYREVDTPGDDNGFAVYNAVQCTDVQWPTSWAVWSSDNHRINRIAPFATWLNAWYNAPCLGWPAPASRQTPMQIDGTGIGNALLIDETLDAATPYPGSLEVRKLYPNSVLLAEPGGTSHADSLFGNECVDGTIAAYLADGTLPTRKPGNRADAFCAPLPVPVPVGAATAASAAAARATVSKLPSAVLTQLRLAAVATTVPASNAAHARPGAINARLRAGPPGSSSPSLPNVAIKQP